MNINEVQALCAEGKIVWTEHVEKRMVQRKISRDDIKRCIMNGEIIEEYLDDYPHPSYLIFGHAEDERVLHVVVSISDGVPRILNVITTYCPDESRFQADMKTRRGK